MIIKEFIKKGDGFSGQDIDSWTSNWDKVDSLVKTSRNIEKDHLSYFFKKYFPKQPKKILEGGCGTGKYVIAYRNLGYDILGVDFSARTIKRLKEDMGSDFPVYEGNVTALPFGDNYFDCYYSGGVIEHFPDGPDKPLKEARRVLKKGGLLLATVPYINLIRRLIFTISKRTLNEELLRERVTHCCDASEILADYKFCEYIFDVKSLTPYFSNNGFLIEAAYPTNFLWGELGFLIRKFINRQSNKSKRIDMNYMAVDKNGDDQSIGRCSSLLKNLAYSFLVTEDIGNIFFKIPITALNYLSGHLILFVAKAV